MSSNWICGNRSGLWGADGEIVFAGIKQTVEIEADEEQKSTNKKWGKTLQVIAPAYKHYGGSNGE